MEEEITQEEVVETPEMKLERIQRTINVARDSVWVVNRELQILARGEPWSEERKGSITRNVGHLKWVVSNDEVLQSGLDISDLVAAVTAGEQELNKH